ncbi:Trp biosynthesis-associated membrane protein [Herbiconiux sp.]|uniref:Trp biosynthesis-associated membrane protein n=1 Tax=Herbiconiux sp. TaxID=1871186 RepID=UPI0025C59CA3|nr:Trp biosynthesis-associated membrane protein [Herbiconiux sp.]
MTGAVTNPERSTAERSGRRLKLLTILVVLVASGLTFLAWSQSWGSLTLIAGSNTETTLDVPGSAAAPALSALSLAGLALAGALAIAGPLIRIVLGALEVLLGASVLWSAIGAIADPVGVGASVVTSSTGVAGTASIRELVTPASTSVWPALTVLFGAVMVLAGLLIIATVRRWPAAGRRYQAVTFEGADGRRSSDPGDFFDEEMGDEQPGDDEPGDGQPGRKNAPDAASAPETADDPEGAATLSRDTAVDNWDDLTRGTDPTR